jgi:hypothetical protein
MVLLRDAGADDRVAVERLLAESLFAFDGRTVRTPISTATEPTPGASRFSSRCAARNGFSNSVESSAR